ncbi:helix-turn-helix domain-containing protein [Streptomyces sp. NBC_00868]|uniref:helix-turn-helix domain-containing protein n=1 Tax=unclassified Streptomyces TaxID=2593676 RepID=UPI003250E6D2|nr:helix-turn-helix domain-containing protein [Streptomyces sp. NBC_00868]
MGRPEQPVPYPHRALGRLALGLRHARHAAHLTYSQLAGNAAGFSRPTLQRAASGKALPTREAVTAYARACGTDPGPLLALWEAAARERVIRTLHRPAPAVRQIRDEADMGAALRNLHLEAGAPSYREIERRTRNSVGTIRVPRTTVHQILSRQRFPSSRDQLRALLVALGVPVAGHENWLRAWSRVNRRLQADRRAARTRRDKLQRRVTRPRHAPLLDGMSLHSADTPERRTTAPAARTQPSWGLDPSPSAWMASLSGTVSQITPLLFLETTGPTTGSTRQTPRTWPPSPPGNSLFAMTAGSPDPETGGPSFHTGPRAHVPGG